ncbi:hypothetical protein Gbth_086_007 [Gluconobacter thailandicus F149-1 = NBRC 100600]|uniref:Uncharacterized protein n=1 Tax=Acetobacter aceti NBRC 14818 TaxID=887700 RepID=A0AB33IRX3_ACEAC|nr:hypothetical protein EMQ_P117 [Acetobacter aceti NBRC 14818]GAN94744.1 hypothetical protein Gbth_086_007 [Gluconobacter thailandicus F149-1 = NBRC 100600]GBR60143.1 hypothetical protein AA100600_1762 [Gluconobacter thailandicus F149-1 = NBRC 100600]GEL88738.1 hypothetical protein GTH01_30960 [Gluconobacter thailandicus F149-1 = NBRC 100600]
MTGRSPLRDDRGEFLAKGTIELIGVIAGLTNQTENDCHIFHDGPIERP